MPTRPSEYTEGEIISQDELHADYDFFEDLTLGTKLPTVLNMYVQDPSDGDIIKAVVIDTLSGGEPHVFTTLRAVFKDGAADSFSIDINGTEYQVFDADDEEGVVKTVSITPAVSVNEGSILVVEVNDSGSQEAVTIALFGKKNLEVDTTATDQTWPSEIVAGPQFGTNLDILWTRLNGMLASTFNFTWLAANPVVNLPIPFYIVPPAIENMHIIRYYLFALSGVDSGTIEIDILVNGTIVDTVNIDTLTIPGFISEAANLNLEAGDVVSFDITDDSGLQTDIGIQLVPELEVHQCE